MEQEVKLTKYSNNEFEAKLLIQKLSKQNQKLIKQIEFILERDKKLLTDYHNINQQEIEALIRENKKISNDSTTIFIN